MTTVAHENLVGSPTYNFARKESTAEYEILMNKSYVTALLLDLFPPRVGKIAPFGAPLPGMPFLFPQSVSMEPFPKDKTMVQASLVKAKISYKTRDNEQPPDAGTLLTHTTDVGGDFMTLPSSGLRWESETKAIQEEDLQAGKIMPTIEHAMSWDEVAVVPYGAIRASIGCVNNSAFFGAPAETLLFCGASISREVMTDGAQKFKIDYKFTERPIVTASGTFGWNHFYRASEGQWERLKTRPTGEDIYQKVNFAPLFA